MQCEKVLYHFYNVCNLIFKEVRACLSEPQIDLFYDERIGDGIAVAVKFWSDIDPKIIFVSCSKVLRKCFWMILSVAFSTCLLAAKWKKAVLCGEFINILVSGLWKEVIETTMVLFCAISRSNKKNGEY